uniref:nebulin-like n=1 Tax=Gasterosteus aculeatus aculeatus TaxID=481459 RepID=UPI001A99479F|nr:nebulin-like [Gasterosteus aculeatus aculeatus]
MTEVVEEYEEYEEFEEEEIVEEITTTTKHEGSQAFQAGLPSRKVRKKVKVDTSKFMTPYLAHSQKMMEQYSHNKYRHAYDVSRGTPPAIITDSPEMIRIRKAQEQLSEVKYRMEGNKARTTSLYDGEAREVAHVKRVSELISKVLYRQKWDETKDRYLLPPDAPELVLAVKNAANYSKKLYTEDWDEEKTAFYPYSDSPELRRVARAQEVLSDIRYKKGHDLRKAKYTSLADPPEMELARRVSRQRSDLKYKEDYNKNVKGQWCETPYFDVATARVAMENFSSKRYTQDYEDNKDQIYFMQTDTPVYDANKKARIAASEVIDLRRTTLRLKIREGLERVTDLQKVAANQKRQIIKLCEEKDAWREDREPSLTKLSGEPSRERDEQSSADHRQAQNISSLKESLLQKMVKEHEAEMAKAQQTTERHKGLKSPVCHGG